MTVTSSWEGRFRTFSVDAFDVARDRPDRGVVAAGRVEPHQLLAWDRSTGDLRQLTTAAGGIIDGSISADGRWVYYLDDPEATESGRLVRIPWEGGEARLVDGDLAPGFLMHVVSWGSTTAFSIVIGDRCEHRVASSDVDGSRLIATDATFGFVAGFADSGRTLIVARDRADGYRESVFYDVATADEVGRLSAPDCDAFTYLQSPIPRDTRYLAETSASGVRRPMIWDRATDARTLLAVDGMDGEIRCIEWAPDGRSVLLLQIEAATMRFYLIDLETGRRRLLPTPSGALTALPVTFSTLFLTPSEVLTTWQDGAHPRSILAIPVDDGEPVIVLGDKDPPPGHPWRSVSFTSTDGTPIQGWLALPACDGPVPAVIDVHGGPGVAQFDEFLPWLQAFVDAGYAVLSINYRSSSTFGEAFLRSIDGHPGELEVEDMAAAADYLVAEGIADPARILAEGWSYGGYLTLMALSRRPDRWAGGICGVGIGDMVAQHAEAASFIGQMFTRVFQGTPDEIPERYVEASPITHAERVVAPLQVIHGRGDIRCPEGQMQRYLDRMAALGKDVSVEWFDAGHLGGIANPATGIQHTGLMLDFADRVTSKDAPLPIA